MKINIQNEAKCKACGDVVKCKTGEKTKTCSCGSLAVDGNRDFISRSIQSGQASWVKQSAYIEFNFAKKEE